MKKRRPIEVTLCLFKVIYHHSCGSSITDIFKLPEKKDYLKVMAPWVY